MHERNKYKTPPDFAKLAEKYESFSRYVKISEDRRGHLNFKDPEAVRELTYTLLKEDFGLSLEIPLDRLIPTLPLRLNYILWIEDLISEGGHADSLTGIDIGCGASCIYPLLGTKTNGWEFIASEADELSHKYAKKNIEMNTFDDNITLKKVGKTDLLKGIIDKEKKYEFCMCNPPFFCDRLEAAGDNSRTDRRPLPHSVCTATDNETVAEGGEVGFVKKMIQESLELKSQIRWYTSMLGKKSSWKTLKQHLKDLKIPFITSTTFQQGKTTRWGICWSFDPNIKISPQPKPQSKINTAPFTFVIKRAEIDKRYKQEERSKLGENPEIKCVCGEIEKILESLEITFTASTVFNSAGDFDNKFVGHAYKNTWSHQRQKKRMAKRLKLNEKDASCETSNAIDTTASGMENIARTEKLDKTEKLYASTIKSMVDQEEGTTGILSRMEAEQSYTTSNKDNVNQSTDATGHLCSSEAERPDIGQKRTHETSETPNQTTSQGDPLFKFEIIVSLTKDLKIVEESSVKVGIACLDGSREIVHQFFMHFRNRFNGEQIRSPKR